MFYFKKIIAYFDYYEFGEKKKSCGYSKIMVKDWEVTVEIHIKGLGIKESCVCDIYTSGEEKARLGKFVLDQGTGCYNACFDGKDMDGNKLRIFEISGFYITVGENKYCETAWEWGKLPAESDYMEERSDGDAALRKTLPIEVSVPPEELWTEGKSGREEREPEEAEAQEEKAEPMDAVRTEETSVQAEPEESATGEEAEAKPQEEKMTEEWKGLFLHKTQISDGTEQKASGTKRLVFQETLHEDKWEQLCSVYPVCHPFEDGEDYISIAPKDFIILRKEYQNLVGNSFLLHSYYNYHHIILGKTGNDEMYYMGVPGSYLDREKRVAVMFGFEGFAQSVRGNEKSAKDRMGKPAVAAGAFGYYMRKVEI